MLFFGLSFFRGRWRERWAVAKLSAIYDLIGAELEKGRMPMGVKIGRDRDGCTVSKEAIGQILEPASSACAFRIILSGDPEKTRSEVSDLHVNIRDSGGGWTPVRFRGHAQAFRLARAIVNAIERSAARAA